MIPDPDDEIDPGIYSMREPQQEPYKPPHGTTDAQPGDDAPRLPGFAKPESVRGVERG